MLDPQVPVFIAEIAPKNLRGGLATSNQVWKVELKSPVTRMIVLTADMMVHWLHVQLLICSGSSATYIIGALVAWRNLVLVGMLCSHQHFIHCCSSNSDRRELSEKIWSRFSALCPLASWAFLHSRVAKMAGKALPVLAKCSVKCGFLDVCGGKRT